MKKDAIILLLYTSIYSLQKIKIDFNILPINLPFRIGTRDSELAIWQATAVQNQLAVTGHQSELVFIKSEGDIDLATPLYDMGVEGIFTKSLDIALLSGTIDIAVHSMKDVPTTLARGLVQAAVLPRGNYLDVLIPPASIPLEENSWIADPVRKETGVIATSSMRRRAQWLHRYPQDVVENLRGNVNTRLAKVESSKWNAAIFAAAGLERLDKYPTNAIVLDWMLPAPAQGAVVILCREKDEKVIRACKTLNDKDTDRCTAIEKSFLKALNGGCTTPVGILAQIQGDMVVASGSIHSADGQKKVGLQKIMPISDCSDMGRLMAVELLQNGGAEILKEFEDARRVKNT